MAINLEELVKRDSKTNEHLNTKEDKKVSCEMKKVIIFLEEFYEENRIEIDKRILKLNNIDDLKQYSNEMVKNRFPIKQTLKYIETCLD